MNPAEAPKLHYASPAPVNCKIRWHVSPEVSAVWVDHAPPERVRHEAIAVLVLIVSGLALAGFGVYLAFRPAEFWTVPRVAMAAAGTALIIPGWIYLAADAWQNCGVVLHIEVRGNRLTWTKRNLWGDRTIVWPVSRMTGVVVWRGVGLRVRRWRGIPLNAFAFHTTEDLLWAASVLRDAIAMRQGSLTNRA